MVEKEPEKKLVRIRGKLCTEEDKCVIVDALLDSGSNVNLIDSYFAEQLGVDIEELPKKGKVKELSIGHSQKSWGDVTLSAKKFDIRSGIELSDFDAKFSFAKDLREDAVFGKGLIDRENFPIEKIEEVKYAF